MKFFFSIFIIFFWPLTVFSYEFQTSYKIKTKGIKIGSLTWVFNKNENSYKTSLTLQNKGLISALYPFEGDYKANGLVTNNSLFAKEYYQFWKTKKKEKTVKIIFKNEQIIKMKIFPTEIELPRIEYQKIKSHNDPLSSFLNILLNQQPAPTIDGRRVYLLNPIKKEGGMKIQIENYVNIWTDHKRNDLEYIEVFFEKNQLLPRKINIMFKGSIFSLNKF